MRATSMRHEFVEHVPAELEPGVVYISIPYATAVHSCCCGCGNRVATPLSPTDWRLTYDGDTVTLDPSIGNWQFPCRSHYWIRRGVVSWSGSWSQAQIEEERQRDIHKKERYYEPSKSETGHTDAQSPVVNGRSWRRLFSRLKR
jgi:Family of unknown function (DUF6527)